MFFSLYNKTKKFNHKMKVIHVNLEVNMKMDVNIILIMDKYFFHSSNVWMKTLIEFTCL
jgi:hypothetical protein